MMDRDELAALDAAATKGPWEIQDGCSWRRIGTVDEDGGAICPVTSRDGHPDLVAWRGDIYANLRIVTYLRNHVPEILALIAENERLREANGILEDALQEVGDDYPGSSCQEWCQQQVKAARAALNPPQPAPAPSPASIQSNSLFLGYQSLVGRKWTGRSISSDGGTGNAGHLLTVGSTVNTSGLCAHAVSSAQASNALVVLLCSGIGDFLLLGGNAREPFRFHAGSLGLCRAIGFPFGSAGAFDFVQVDAEHLGHALPVVPVDAVVCRHT